MAFGVSHGMKKGMYSVHPLFLTLGRLSLYPVLLRRHFPFVEADLWEIALHAVGRVTFSRVEDAFFGIRIRMSSVSR